MFGREKESPAGLLSQFFRYKMGSLSRLKRLSYLCSYSSFTHKILHHVAFFLHLLSFLLGSITYTQKQIGFLCHLLLQEGLLGRTSKSTHLGNA